MSIQKGIPIKSTIFPFIPGSNNASGQKDQTPQDPPSQMGSLYKPATLQRDNSKARDQGNECVGASLGSREVIPGDHHEISIAGLDTKRYEASSEKPRSFSYLLSRENSSQSPEEESLN